MCRPISLDIVDGTQREHRTEPDYRFTLANERTFLAWIRTALALLAGAVATATLVPEFGFPGANQAIGAALAVGGTAVALAAVRRWQLVERAIRLDLPLPRSRLPALLSAALGVLCLGVVALLLFGPAGAR